MSHLAGATRHVFTILNSKGLDVSNPYKAIFAAPGAKGFATAAFVARLPIAMAPIGIVFMLSQRRGESWLAGAVAATFTLATAIAAPQISRLVDQLDSSGGSFQPPLSRLWPSRC